MEKGRRARCERSVAGGNGTAGMGIPCAMDSETGQDRIERVGQTLREEPVGQLDTFQDR